MRSDIRTNLLHSSCGTNKFGEILDWKNEPLPTIKVDGSLMVELDWIYGDRRAHV